MGDGSVYRLELTCGNENRRILEKVIDSAEFPWLGDMIFGSMEDLKLWGPISSIPDTLSNRYRPDVMGRLLNLAELGNFNILRVWGERTLSRGVLRGM